MNSERTTHNPVEKSITSSWGRLAIALTNIAPLLGIIFAQWSVFDVVFLYWLENVVIGVITVLRMTIGQSKGALFVVGSLFFAAFFCVHYGMFTYVHGIFVFSLLADPIYSESAENLIQNAIALLHNNGLLIAITVIALGHLLHFIQAKIQNTIDGAAAEMHKPYKRIIILHIALLIGGGISLFVEQGFAIALIMVALKTFFDLKSGGTHLTASDNKASFMGSKHQKESDDVIQKLLDEKLATPEFSINGVTYTFDSFSEMTQDPRYQKAMKWLKWLMPRKQFTMYQQAIEKKIEEEPSE